MLVLSLLIYKVKVILFDFRSEGIVDLNNPEVFNNMKRRLRVVLSSTDISCIEYVPNVSCKRSM